ncbi:MAG: hypothetical protein HY717_15550 [Planctomycetes bacterium]|nr:hypothetical protein [Planctomycetota bacterium]
MSQFKTYFATFVVCASITDFASSQTPTFKIWMELEGVDCGGKISRPAGSLVQMDGNIFLEASEPGASGWFFHYSGVGGSFDFDNQAIEGCHEDCAAEIIGLPVFFLGRSVLKCWEFIPDPILNPNPIYHESVLENLSFKPGVGLPSGISRILKFEFSVTVPSQPEEVRIHFLYAGECGGVADLPGAGVILKAEPLIVD